MAHQPRDEALPAPGDAIDDEDDRRDEGEIDAAKGNGAELEHAADRGEDPDVAGEARSKTSR